MDEILKYIKDNKDLLDLLCGSGLLVAIGGVLWRFFKWGIEKYYTSKKRQDTSPFEIIQPHSNVLKAILGGNDDDPLTDRNIPYQVREEGRDVLHELRQIIDEARCVLILGRTGLGKTREAIQLAQKLSDEGWTILNLCRNEWLDIPSRLPEGLPTRKIAFFLDDLNNRMNVSQFEQSPKAGEIGESLHVPLQKRLSQLLDWYEDACTKNEIKVIATARDETVPLHTGDVSEWEKLGFEKYPELWKRFKRFDLPEPDNKAVVSLLEATVPKLEIQSNMEEYSHIAQKNDRTFANVVINLRKAKKQGKLTAEDYVDTLQGSWEERYHKATQKYPATRYIYDAVELLQIVNIELHPEMIEASARVIAGGHIFKRVLYGWTIRSAMKFLIQTEYILQPADGQIEAKDTRVEWKLYLPHLFKLILSQAKKPPEKMINSLIGFSLTLWEQDQLEQVETLHKRILQINPQISYIQHNLGVVLQSLGRYEEAIQAYQQAIALDPKYATPHNGLGNVYSGQGRYGDAISAYHQAIQLDPEFAYPHNGLGNVYSDQSRYEEAIQAYQQAIALDPKFAYPYNGLGNVWYKQGRYDDAISAYNQAIRLDPKCATPHNGLGAVYRSQDRYEEAIQAYQQAIALDPKFATPHNGLGNVYRSQDHYEEAIQAYRQAIALDPKFAYPYNGLGNVYSDQGRYEEAIQAYQQAIALDPKDATPHNGLGEIYMRLKEFDKSRYHFNERIRLSPDTAFNALVSLGIIERYYDKYDESIGYLQNALDLWDRAWQVKLQTPTGY